MGSKHDCHTGNPLVFDTGEVKVYAGGTNRNGGWHRMDPSPDLAMGPIGVIVSPKTRDVLPIGWGCTDTTIGGSTTVLEIDWPDYNVPMNLGKEFWLALIEDIKVKGITTISCQCMGGHGRTGVQLCILAHYLIPEKQHTWDDASSLIKHIRGLFCEHAVESKAQEQYIAEMCDIPLGESTITLTQNKSWLSDPSAFVDFDDFNELTDEELIAQEKANKKKEKALSKRKPKNVLGFKKGYSTPIVDGWSLVYCPNCQSYEWRRAIYKHMEEGCDVCGHEHVFSIDEEVLTERNMRCQVSEMMCHTTEMYDDIKCKFVEAEEQGLATKFSKNNEPLIKNGTKWYPMSFFMREGEGELICASEIWKETVKKRKASKPSKKTLDDYVVEAEGDYHYGSVDISELMDPVTGKGIDQRGKRFSVDD